MSPLECSECFGDQLLHRTYTRHLTLHSRPNFTRKRDTRSESLEIPINVVLPQRGTAEPFLRLHNLYPSPRCARQAALPRLSRRVTSQHSHPLNRFSSVPLDPMERPTSQADLELDYNPPRVQLSDEMFVFQDGRWVNENCRLYRELYFSPSSSFHHKLHHKRLAKEYLLQEENKALREENKALREENRTLRKENRILQVFWEERKATLGREESRAASPLLHKDSAALEVAKDAALQMHRLQEDSSLQLLREENRALRQRLEQRKAYWGPAEEKAGPGEESTAVPSAHEELPGPGLLPDQGTGLSSAFEESKGPSPPQDDSKTLRVLRQMVSNLSGSSGDEESKAGPGLADGSQSLELLREMHQALQALREENQDLQVLREENRLLREENRALHALREEHRVFQEENKALWENKTLKLQQKLVIDTVTEVTARMEMLIEELYAFVPAKSKDPKKPSRV
ncbi:protein chibby homolog 2 isoform X1 [Lynx canadensis]|uniref:protein chibby homolog 2 isoform X1 n=1 Tax=Lynx canadensis TaxID=61383 RepID=UPI0011AFF181|nr:protein chibby homolog 2 isoform X1 [Lynx canadensis]